jgi:hypothetical protein
VFFLTSCQAINKEKPDVHFNLSLTAVNLAKIDHWYSIPIEQRKAFSLSDIKTINHNTLLLERFITMFAIKPNVLKNNLRMSKSSYYTALSPLNVNVLLPNYCYS